MRLLGGLRGAGRLIASSRLEPLYCQPFGSDSGTRIGVYEVTAQRTDRQLKSEPKINLLTIVV